MSLFPVYTLYPVELKQGNGCYVVDANGQKYLDLYGGHAVISIGHSHPHFTAALKDQIDHLIFYSNSVENHIQEELGRRLTQESGYDDHQLFMVSSGAEANENALKLASFHTGNAEIITYTGSFHGRTTGVVATTDNPNILPKYGSQLPVHRLSMNDAEGTEKLLKTRKIAAVIIEGIQGVAGIVVPDDDFLRSLRTLCNIYNTPLIIDEVQSGFGRTGDFFAHQHSGVQADIVSCAKGMGNGFPVGGILIHPKFKARKGMLGTTFGGNHLACRATLAVLDVLKQENLLSHAKELGEFCIQGASQFLPTNQIKGRGLMIGLDLGQPIADIRKRLIFTHHIFTGSAKNPNVIRLLPPLNVTKPQLEQFFVALEHELNS